MLIIIIPGTFNRPMAVDGKIEVRPMMYVALTYDHRIVDGQGLRRGPVAHGARLVRQVMKCNKFICSMGVA
jgi:hypothetical protein